MRGDPGAVSVGAIAIGQTVASYQFFLPRLADVRRAQVGDVDWHDDVVLGQAAAAAVSLSVGVLLAWMTGSAIPVLVTLFVAGVIAAFYQFAMNRSQGNVSA